MAVKNAKAAARRRAREIALQALYAWKLAGGDALAHSRTLEGWERCDQKFAEQLIAEITCKSEALEASIAPHLDRSLASLSPIERVIRSSRFKCSNCPRILCSACFCALTSCRVQNQ